jgi:methyltransferase
MTFRAVVLAVIAGFMAAEARVSRVNDRRLRARGGIRPPGDPYLGIALLYPAAFVLMGSEGLWRAATTAATLAETPSWTASGVVLFAAGKALKYWAIRSLGERWSFHVMVLPGEPLIAHGPYRYVAHPNYVGVVGELVGTAMMMGARVTGPVAILAFGAVLIARIRFESRVLAPLRRGGVSGSNVDVGGPDARQ